MRGCWFVRRNARLCIETFALAAEVTNGVRLYALSHQSQNRTCHNAFLIRESLHKVEADFATMHN